ncbi:aspartic proteinase CDR1-like [Alnus glutinosa]|uniref:aspartic proteinase CDR1-like n=1 Tax=Alnus glutinosa TaxID=3517 RepID=UPI002D79AAC1|nr:aspartic proteinase CDR1-like [Alnus glutinosa]
MDFLGDSLVVRLYLGYPNMHILKLSMGTPQVDIYAIADTGSDLIWTQCVPCPGCYNQIYPLFDPLKSSTYNDFSCQSKQCNILSGTCDAKKLCNYAYKYGDGTLAQGILAKETVALTSTSGGKVSVDIVFGCGHNDTGTLNDHEMGIVGLGGGIISFVSQIASTIGSKRFSHCFVPFDVDPSIPSKMSFGNGSEVLGDGWVSIGNVILDSGTPSMYLPQEFHDRLVAEVRKQIPLDPMVLYLPRLCYDTANQKFDAPILTACFEGADVLLMPTQTFISRDGILYFAVYPSDKNDNDGFGIYGNFAQSNFLIGIDMEKMTVSFKPTDCTK